MVVKCKHASRSPRGLVKTQIPGLKPSLPDSVDLGWYLRICISNKFPGDG